jgi:hypothetical protein
MRNATRVTTGVMGTLFGLAGLEHGIGEIMQGNIAPAGIMFVSWPDAKFFSNVAGEPAMSLVPNMLVSGVLTILVSLAFIAWATRFVQRRNGALVLILMSIILLLVGGGFGPPVSGIILGIATTRMKPSLHGWPSRLPVGVLTFITRIWPECLSACVLAWLVMLPGSSILAYYFGVDDPTLTQILILAAFSLLFLTIFTGYVHDGIQQEDNKTLSNAGRASVGFER